MRSYERFAMLLAALSIIASTLNQPATGTPAAQHTVTATATAREATPELRRQTFEIVWRTIKEKHFDPNFNGVDWNKVHDLYAPRVARVKSDKEFYELLQAILVLLQFQAAFPGAAARHEQRADEERLDHENTDDGNNTPLVLLPHSELAEADDAARR